MAVMSANIADILMLSFTVASIDIEPTKAVVDERRAMCQTLPNRRASARAR